MLYTILLYIHDPILFPQGLNDLHFTNKKSEPLAIFKFGSDTGPGYLVVEIWILDYQADISDVALHSPPTFPQTLLLAYPWQQFKSSGQVLYLYLWKKKEEAGGWGSLPGSPPPFSCAPCCADLHKVITPPLLPRTPYTKQDRNFRHFLWETDMTWHDMKWYEL